MSAYLALVAQVKILRGKEEREGGEGRRRGKEER